MAMNEYSIFPNVPELEPHQQIQFEIISRRLVGYGGGVQPRPTELACSFMVIILNVDVSSQVHILEKAICFSLLADALW